MHYDFSQLDDVQSFVSVPPGTYPCRVAEVREGDARDGSSRWNLRLEVALGEYAGRTAGWDSLTWSDRGVRRVQAVLGALGFEVRGTVDIGAQELVGRCADVVFELEEREDPTTGVRQQRLTVPYAGYAPNPGLAERLAAAEAGGSYERPGPGDELELDRYER